jgi:hypothetical protein
LILHGRGGSFHPVGNLIGNGYFIEKLLEAMGVVSAHGDPECSKDSAE